MFPPIILYFCKSFSRIIAMKKYIILLATLFLTILPTHAQGGSNHLFDMSKNLEVFNTIYKNLELMYVDTLDANEVVGTAIKAMLKSLDPYTEYYPEENMQELKEIYTGKFAGIGALIRYNAELKRVVIDEPYEGMPADEAGLKKGDIILSIDDSLMTDKSVSYVSDHLRGDPGTSFILKIERPTTGKKMKMKITHTTGRGGLPQPAPVYGGMRQRGAPCFHRDEGTGHPRFRTRPAQQWRWFRIGGGRHRQYVRTHGRTDRIEQG